MAYTTKAKTNATEETYILRIIGQFIGLSRSSRLRLWPDEGLPSDILLAIRVEEEVIDWFVSCFVAEVIMV